MTSDFRMQNKSSRTIGILERAFKSLVGGVNSPVRAFQSVGGAPLIVERASGAHLWDADGREYIDFIGSWGALILGHANPAIVAAIQEQAARGTSYGMTTELEVELAERIKRAIPSIEKIRFVSSGTEATMSAVRLARGFTKRDFILKFEGCYHGHADSFLSEAGSGLATLGIASSPGVPEALAALTLNAPYNDLGAVERLFAKHPNKIAAVIVEPVAANMGVVPPAPGFLEGLREITRRAGTVLIFDEVITGFRLCYGGAQSIYKIEPDLTALGKIIGGGLPVAVYGGRAEIMDHVAPLGAVYQAGTLSGNPLAMRAGIEALKQLEESGFYDALSKKAERFFEGLRRIIREGEIAAQVNSCGSLATLFFSATPVRNYADAKKSDTRRFAAFFRAMLERGILLAPSQFEALFISAAHTEADLDVTLSAVSRWFYETRRASAV
ncbi:MAG TPA: glutamate-1-semialdehyde 2,1-aminomutase [Candidatus Acidoferrales bacterium]|nr:glutamate-1-semialdehyde 2,1-aminomutase [Candidatus Acidoferrales bacterium]